MLAVGAEANEVAVPRSGALLFAGKFVPPVLVCCGCPAFFQVDGVLLRLFQAFDVNPRAAAVHAPAPGGYFSRYPFCVGHPACRCPGLCEGLLER